MKIHTHVKMAGVDSILFESSQRAKRIIISIKPFKGIRVAIPRWASLQQAIKFVESQKAWIQRQMATLHEVEEQLEVAAQEMELLNIAEAKAALLNRLSELANQHGFTYSKARIRNYRTKWGSCSSNNEISLNTQLARLPQELIDYVLLHELVHTKVQKHGPKFWKELDKYAKGSQELKSQLGKYYLAMPPNAPRD